MTATATSPVARPRGLAFLWQRRLDRYPTGGERYLRLVLAVLATVAIYYEQYTLGAVSTLVQTQLHMSFLFLLTALGIGNLLGAFGSLAAGLADRLGRAIWAWIVRFVVFISFLAVPHVVSSANTLVNSAPYLAAAKKAQAAGQPVSGALARHLAGIQHAAVATIGQWQVWMGIAIACAVFLALTVPFLRGPWSPARARAEQDEHNRRRDAEIARLHAG